MKLTIQNQQLRIAQLTDIHFKTWQNGHPILAFDFETIRLIERLLKQLQPDLLMITGDLVDSPFVEDPEGTQEQVISWLNTLDIPVLITYGNHDSECHTSREALLTQHSLLKYQIDKENYCLIESRENYTVPVYYQDQVVSNIFVMDSGDYVDENDVNTKSVETTEPLSPYAYLTDEQNNWLKETGNKVQTISGGEDILFLHIPLPEYKLANNHLMTGVFEEIVCSSTYNSGTFDVIKENTNIQYISAGHDHDNNFQAEVDSIYLCYGQPSGYGSYGKLKRGIRYFDISTEGEISTRIVKS